MKLLRRVRISKATALVIGVAASLVWFVYATVVNHVGDGRAAFWENLLVWPVILGAIWMARD